MSVIGQQHPMTEGDPTRLLDPVAADPLEDQARVGLTLLTENAIRGVVREWDVRPHHTCAACGCVGTMGERA